MVTNQGNPVTSPFFHPAGKPESDALTLILRALPQNIDDFGFAGSSCRFTKCCVADKQGTPNPRHVAH